MLDLLRDGNIHRNTRYQERVGTDNLRLINFNAIGGHGTGGQLGSYAGQLLTP